jgi:quercetin dioxygenase-like cupin family protein
MTTLKYHDMPVTKIREGVERRLGYTDHLMMAIIDFSDGPKSQPDPLHSHLHEQVSYVVEGEIIFVMDDQQMRLRPGDMFLVPSGKPHSIQLLTERARLIDCFTPLREDFLK